MQNFKFQSVTEKQVISCNIKLDAQKATEVDAITPKILKCALPPLTLPIRDIANEMQKKEVFPSRLKMAQVAPVYKKDDPFIQKNYRPVSILPTMSNIYERLLSDQLSAHFNNIFHNFLPAFRASYGCQITLLRIVEDWKEVLDKNMYIDAVLMDLSKAFDCLPHDLLLAKLKAYGVSEESCNLMASYFGNRHQRVKIGKMLAPGPQLLKESLRALY